MYRHFLLRVCDVANTARIVDSGQVDFEELREASEVAIIWPGVATYLNIISQYMEHYPPGKWKVVHRLRYSLRRCWISDPRENLARYSSMWRQKFLLIGIAPVIRNAPHSKLSCRCEQGCILMVIEP
jgi:hypothetical protein